MVEGNYAVDFEAYYEGDSLRFQVKTGDVTIKVRNNNFGGEIRGFLDIRDDLIPQLQESLNSLQYNLITEVNNVHEAGYNLDGQTGQSFFSRPLSYQSEAGFLTAPEVFNFNTGIIEINDTDIEITN